MNRQQRGSLRWWLTLVVVGLLAVGTLAACGSDSDDSSDSGGSSSDSNGDSSDLPDKITIGYQNIPNGDLIVKSQGWLEDALPDVEIEWALFDSGGSVNEAFLGSNIDIGLAGSSPVSRGLSSGIDYVVPWIFNVIGEAEALVVKSDISSIDDLEGKTIATPFASTAHFSLLAALEEADVDPSSVNIIDAEPDDIYAAWTQDDIDGTYVWNPNLAEIIADGGTVLVTSAELAEQGKTTYDLGVVSKTFAEEYPRAVEIWVEQQNRAVELIKSDPDEAASIIAGELDITDESAADQLGDLVFVDASEQVGADFLGGGLAENLYAAAQFNHELGEITAVEPESVYVDAVRAEYAQAVVDGSG